MNAVKLTSETTGGSQSSTLETYYAAGWTDELLVQHNLAEWLFKEGDWAWTTDNGWVRLSGGTFDDQHPLQANERTYSPTGYEWRDDKYPSLLKFDPINGTVHPVEYKSARVGFKEIQDELIKSIVSVEMLTNEPEGNCTNCGANIKSGFNASACDECNGNKQPKKQTLDEWVNENIYPKLTSEQHTPNITFNNIKDNLDFMELVDKFKDTHTLRGGQKADGTWYLNGVVK